MALRRAAVVRYNYESLEEILGLPVGHKIRHAQPPTAESVMDDYIEIVIEGPDLPETHHGECLVRINPVYEQIKVLKFKEF